MESKYKIGVNSITNGFKAEKRHSTPDNEVLPKKFRSGSESPSSKTYVSQNLSKQREALPVYAVKNKLLEEINKHSTLIIIGETGCGKTTQIPQYIREARLAKRGSVAITQPRRVAAVSVATRVAKEMRCRLGETVGYAVRFEDVTSPQTALKYMTDGMLLREALADNLLMSYNIVILDEAHERTINTDVLFGIVKQAQSIRKAKEFTPLKIILMSATMDVDQFSSYFDDAPIVYLEGRQHHVDIYSTLEPQDDYTFSILVTIFQIHRQAPANDDILVFLTGQEEIEAMVHNARVVVKEIQGNGPMLKVYPLFANMASNHQLEVLRPGGPNTRKLIIATNVAETSITIPGVKYVIDSGMVKMRTHNPVTGLDTLKVQRISKAQAWQRAGRAGRERPGACYRIYTQKEFEKMSETTVPEILRCNLTGVVLNLLAMGVNALTFDFMDKPPTESITEAMKQLTYLGAIISVDHPELTQIGQRMAQFPLDPCYSKMIIAAVELECVEEIITLVSILSTESIRVNAPKRKKDAAAAHQKFCSSTGDHITNLNIYREYAASSTKKKWCYDNYLSFRNLEYAANIRSQLLEICKSLGISKSSCGQETEKIRKCLIAGNFSNIAQLQKEGHYLTIGSKQVVHIHPSSVLFRSKPPLLIFGELVMTGKCYMRQVSTVEPEWVSLMMPSSYYKRHCLTG